ncbi:MULTISPECIES: helix-turn-helix domain-containing protein [Rhodococcus]|uniref:helix-turn-helix domain-containing protein n=1 Tax=Rhodococcus TaxID=1827 RepID=UPI0009BFD6AC|nr:helix-turn-helix domain-containing protein [Rhodococcus erythropolis]
MSSATTLPELRAFSVPEVSERLQISQRAVWRLLADGQLKTLFARKPGVPVRIPAESLRALLANGHRDGIGGDA